MNLDTELSCFPDLIRKLLQRQKPNESFYSARSTQQAAKRTISGAKYQHNLGV